MLGSVYGLYAGLNRNFSIPGKNIVIVSLNHHHNLNHDDTMIAHKKTVNYTEGSN